MITALEVNKVEANREVKDPIANMKFSINFDGLKVDKEKDNVEVAFTFTASYEGSNNAKQVGSLKIMGNIVAKESKKDIEEIQKKWDQINPKTKQAEHTLPLKFAENIINLVNFECGARGTLVAYSIGFVAPIPLSPARLQENPDGVATSG